MPDSDDDYIQSVSDDDAGANRVSSRSEKALGKSSSAARGGGGFEVARTWENIAEGADGTISGSLEELLDAGKRRRYVR